MEAVLDHYGVEYSSDRTGNQSFKCPVHDESNPSASLRLDEGVFHCHACGAGGSGFDLIMQKEGVDFQAARQIAETITGASYLSVRGGPARVASRTVSRGSGYQPRTIRKVQAGVRRERTRWV